MKNILTIEHIACEPLGSFEREAGELSRFTYVRPYAGDEIPDSLTGYDGAIILGGPMAVYEKDVNGYIDQELVLIQNAKDGGIPVLGICLGSQLIAAAAGARVYPGPKKETGWGSVELTDEAARDLLFSGLPSPLTVFHLHGDTFDLPDDAVRLAGNENYDNQAFRWGKNIYGLQFHIEPTPEMVSEWAGEYRDYVCAAGDDPEEIIDGISEKSDELRSAARHVIKKFLELC